MKYEYENMNMNCGKVLMYDGPTWLFEELVGVSSKVISLRLDEVGRKLFAPFAK